MKKEIEEIKKIQNESGDVTVSENVIATVVKNTVSEIEGVKAIIGEEPVGNSVIEIISSKTKKKEKGIKVDIKGKAELAIEIYVVLKYGTNVIEVAKNIQEKVKETVESVIGMHVKDIDVFVDRIDAE